MDALNHKGTKGDKLSANMIAEQMGDSRSQVFRVIKLTELTIELLAKVDTGKLAFNPAVELASLSHEEQREVVYVMELDEMKPSLSQAVKLRKLKNEGNLTTEIIHEILSEDKSKETITNKSVSAYRQYFPKEYSASQINEIILELLERYQNKQTQNSNDILSTASSDTVATE